MQNRLANSILEMFYYVHNQHYGRLVSLCSAVQGQSICCQKPVIKSTLTLKNLAFFASFWSTLRLAASAKISWQLEWWAWLGSVVFALKGINNWIFYLYSELSRRKMLLRSFRTLSRTFRCRFVAKHFAVLQPSTRTYHARNGDYGFKYQSATAASHGSG